MIITLAIALAAATPSAKAAEPAPAPTAAATPTAERRYCVVNSNTGSRIPQRDCRTRADWLKQGYDPTAPDQQ